MAQVQKINRNRSGSTPSGPTRRDFLATAAFLAGGGLITWYGLNEASREDDFHILKVDEGPIAPHNPGIYVKFRDTIFRVYRVAAEDKDNPTRLIKRAHYKYSPEEPDLLNLARAEELFSVVNSRAIDFGNLPNGEVKNFKTKIPPIPFVKPPDPYLVPVRTAYASLDQILGAYRR